VLNYIRTELGFVHWRDCFHAALIGFAVLCGAWLWGVLD